MKCRCNFPSGNWRYLQLSPSLFCRTMIWQWFEGLLSELVVEFVCYLVLESVDGNLSRWQQRC